MTGDSSGHAAHGGHPGGSVGSLGSEAAQLLDALALRLASARQQRADQQATPGPRSAQLRCPDCGGPIDEMGSFRPPDGPTTCTGCPVCKLLAVIRGERPEVTAAFVDAASTVVSALRSLLAEPGPDGPYPPSDGPATAADATASATGGSAAPASAGSNDRPSALQRITIR